VADDCAGSDEAPAAGCSLPDVDGPPVSSLNSGTLPMSSSLSIPACQPAVRFQTIYSESLKPSSLLATLACHISSVRKTIRRQNSKEKRNKPNRSDRTSFSSGCIDFSITPVEATKISKK
jgi:hypothetical protein